jgi:prepilin-type N-terminal cleavage/methylation domain-containing protein
MKTRCASTRRSATHGMTLVEVMVAMTVLAMAFAGIFAIFKQSLMLVESSRDYTRVTQILQSEIERMRSMNWADITEFQAQSIDDIKILPASSGFAPDTTFTSAFGERYSFFRIVVQPVGSPNSREVYFVAQWKDGWGKEQRLMYRTLFARNGLNDYYYRSF